MCVGELSAFLWRFRHVGPRVHPRGRIARRRDSGGTGESPFQKCLHLAARICCVFATDNHADMHVVKCAGLGFVKTYCALAGFWVGKCRWNHHCRGCSKDFSTHRKVLQQIIVDGQTTARRRQIKYFITVCLARRLWKKCYIPLATFSSCGMGSLGGGGGGFLLVARTATDDEVIVLPMLCSLLWLRGQMSQQICMCQLFAVGTYSLRLANKMITGNGAFLERFSQVRLSPLAVMLLIIVLNYWNGTPHNKDGENVLPSNTYLGQTNSETKKKRRMLPHNREGVKLTRMAIMGHWNCCLRLFLILLCLAPVDVSVIVLIVIVYL